MSLLTGITGAVRANVAASANKFVKGAASSVKSIAGLNPEGSNSALSSTTNLMGGTSSSTLTYPQNVDSDPQQGHYILFHINTRKNGKLLTPKSGKNIPSAVDNIEKSYDIPPPGIGPARGLNQQALSGKNIEKANAREPGKTTSIVLQKLPVKRLEKSIALYMPPNVQVSYQTKYADKEIGSIAMATQDVIDAAVSGSGSTESQIRGVLDAITGSAAQEGIANALNKSLDTIAQGAEALFQLSKGSVVTPRMEMMFEGVGRREFSYSFAFTPKSRQEALIVEDIITHFKFYMTPAYSNPTTRREMDIPGFFEIQYMHKGSENTFLNKVRPCFLTKADVQYGGDRYTAYETTSGRFGEGSPPQKSTLALSFVELEVLDQDLIGQGY